MSHVSDPKEWTKGVFRGARIEGNLILELADGTERVMKYERWGKTALITTQEVLGLTPGTPIEFATWRDYDPNEWFCDVRKI
jgi:hypothetical protein